MTTDNAARPSLTAEIVALIRAREQHQPPGCRVLDDPYAGPLLEASGSRLVGPVRRIGGAALARLLESAAIGLGPFVLARHRAIDDVLVAEAAAGATQAVLLGAGYDSRAYRFRPPAGPARFFEVDLPALSRLKRDAAHRVAAARGLELDHVAFVEVDFARERLEDRLRASGFDAAARTVFVWEGVSYYLPAAAIHGTLDAVAALAAPASGSAIVLDLGQRPPAGEDPFEPLRLLVARASLGAIGEPLAFYLDGDESSAGLLAAHGFAPFLRLDRAGLQALHDRHAAGRPGRVAPGMEVVAGRRIPSAGQPAPRGNTVSGATPRACEAPP